MRVYGIAFFEDEKKMEYLLCVVVEKLLMSYSAIVIDVQRTLILNNLYLSLTHHLTTHLPTLVKDS